MDGAAHIDAAGKGDSDGSWHGHMLEVVEEDIHNGLDRPRGVGGWSMAMDPALGMDHVADAGAGAAYGEFLGTAGEFSGVEVIDERQEFIFVCEDEFDIVSGGPPDEAVRVLVSDVAYLPYMRYGHCAVRVKFTDYIAIMVN